MEIELVLTNDSFKDTAISLIQGFWKAHNHLDSSMKDCQQDYQAWSQEGHQFFLVKVEEAFVGFAHLASRGAEIDWLEDLFILPKFQGQGIGSQVITLLEEKVKKYSESLYIEVSARNLAAMKLYHRLGYDCLNTLTIRKDFNSEKFESVSHECVNGMNFTIRRYKKNGRLDR